MENQIETLSFQFAIRTVNLCEHLQAEKKEFTLSKQLMRAGTSIGARVIEAQQTQNRGDFVTQLTIARKEAVETEYWLRLLYATEHLGESQFTSIFTDCRELTRLLEAIIKSSKQ